MSRALRRPSWEGPRLYDVKGADDNDASDAFDIDDDFLDEESHIEDLQDIIDLADKIPSKGKRLQHIRRKEGSVSSGGSLSGDDFDEGDGTNSAPPKSAFRFFGTSLVRNQQQQQQQQQRKTSFDNKNFGSFDSENLEKYGYGFGDDDDRSRDDDPLGIEEDTMIAAMQREVLKNCSSDVFVTPLSSSSSSSSLSRIPCSCCFRSLKRFLMIVALVLTSTAVTILIATRASPTTKLEADEEASSSLKTWFKTKDELDAAITSYLLDPTENSTTAQTYGYPIGTWNVSQIENFDNLFNVPQHSTNGKDIALAYRQFNEPLDGWDMSHATSLQGMFMSSVKFHQDISMWDVSQVSDFSNMFKDAEAFDSPNLGQWDTRNAKTMRHMFAGALRFQQDISSWNVEQVEDFRFMFAFTQFFDQPLNTWSLNSAQLMTGMFYEARMFDQDLSSWDTSQVVHMDLMFQNAVAFNQDISMWNLENIQQMGGILTGTTRFSQNLCAWKDQLLDPNNLSVIELDKHPKDDADEDTITSWWNEQLLDSLFDSTHGTISNPHDTVFGNSNCPQSTNPQFINGQWAGPFCHSCESN